MTDESLFEKDKVAYLTVGDLVEKMLLYLMKMEKLMILEMKKRFK